MTAPFLHDLRADSADAPPWLSALRGRAADTYGKLGLPTRKVEAWRYTGLSHLAEAGLSPARTDPVVAPDFIPGTGEFRAVLVNGAFRPDLSALGDLPEGVTVGGLADVLRDDPDLIELHIGRLATLPDMPMTALNTAHLADGIVLHVEAGARLERALHLVSLGVGAAAELFYPRLLIVLEEDAAAAVIEHHCGTGGGAYFTNAVAEFDIAAGAQLDHVKLQSDAANATHIAGTHISLGHGAAYEGFVLQTGGAVARNEVHAYLGSAEADFTLNGAYLAAGRQTVDNTTRVRHAAPDCRSRQTFKGVLSGAARGVFQGKVLVERDAQQTDAHQLSRAVLLSDTAEVAAKPELEIYADDVRCSHGATAGELDRAALFYLESRGIPAPVAQRMLVEGFLGETIDEVAIVSARDLIKERIAAWLKETAAPDNGKTDHGKTDHGKTDNEKAGNERHG